MNRVDSIARSQPSDFNANVFAGGRAAQNEDCHQREQFIENALHVHARPNEIGF